MQNKIAFAASAIISALMVTAAWADDEPKRLRCNFTGGMSWTYENGAFKSQAPEPIDFEISDIDLDRQTAHIIAGVGRPQGTLKIVRAINANHFLEVVNEGFLNLTTVYDKDPSSGTYPAVHSRHFGVLGQPVFAQYSGTCTDK
jgi:hypothetical protein